jgi:hypothetical protein
LFHRRFVSLPLQLTSVSPHPVIVKHPLRVRQHSSSPSSFFDPRRAVLVRSFFSTSGVIITPVSQFHHFHHFHHLHLDSRRCLSFPLCSFYPKHLPTRGLITLSVARIIVTRPTLLIHPPSNPSKPLPCPLRHPLCLCWIHSSSHSILSAPVSHLVFVSTYRESSNVALSCNVCRTASTSHMPVSSFFDHTTPSYVCHSIN